MKLNETHDPALRSWVSSANTAGSDFPIQNLPFCIFREKGSNNDFRGGVAIGDQLVDMRCVGALVSGTATAARQGIELASQPTLNGLMQAGPAAWTAIRLELSRLLREGSAPRPDILVSQDAVEFALPARIGDYTDFYTSVHHATAVGKLFRPDAPLLPNYKWVPIAYHGRASTIRVSGHHFKRPCGQTKGAGDTRPELRQSQRLDYEMEVGMYLGPGNPGGEPIDAATAEEHIFGLCLLNDWSARDMQAWEYQPLGPFLSKNFATTVSPWIVTMEALAPYRTAWLRDDADPQPLPYLDYPALRSSGAFDIELEVAIETEQMRHAGDHPARVSKSNFRHAYWTMAQLVAHHSVNGCILQPGDLIGSGTQSGPDSKEAGSLLELTRGGTEPVVLPNGEPRLFVEDGDSIVMRAWAESAGRPRIGFGEARATVLPAALPALCAV